MFEAALKAKTEKIFGFQKTTYDAPDYEAPEQDTLFIVLTDVKCRVSDNDGGRQIAKAVGFYCAFSQATRLPFGFFAKRLSAAASSDTKNLFVGSEIDVTDSPARLQNLHERRVPFTFLYDSQFDPDKGELTSLETEFTE